MRESECVHACLCARACVYMCACVYVSSCACVSVRVLVRLCQLDDNFSPDSGAGAVRSRDWRKSV